MFKEKLYSQRESSESDVIRIPKRIFNSATGGLIAGLLDIAQGKLKAGGPGFWGRIGQGLGVDIEGTRQKTLESVVTSLKKG